MPTMPSMEKPKATSSLCRPAAGASDPCRRPALDPSEACVDAWAVEHPQDVGNWRGRSCAHKQEWGQCGRFEAFCRKTCGACHRATRVPLADVSTFNVSMPCWVDRAAYARPELVRQIVVSASHAPVTAADERLLARAARELREADPNANASRLWLLLHADTLDEQTAAHARAVQQRVAGLGVCVWTPEHVWRALPQLRAALDDSEAYRSYTAPLGRTGGGGDRAYLRRYWWMHTALVLWLSTAIGKQHTSLRHVWRFEPDVQFAGSLATLLNLVSRGAHANADLLLPRFVSQAQEPAYGANATGGRFASHWEANEHLFPALPTAKRLFSLVSAGRFSLRFLRLLALLWRRGVVGYEELLLPAACLTAGKHMSMFRDARACRMAAFSAGAGVPSLSLASGRCHDTDDSVCASRCRHISFRYAPEMACGSFLQALQLRQNQLWHPVKERGCLSRYLSSRSSEGLQDQEGTCGGAPRPGATTLTESKVSLQT